jgi:acetate kinase
VAQLAGLRVLVVNAGSSSLKVSLVVEGDSIEASDEVEASKGRFDTTRLEEVVGAMKGVQAVGHRVVHGGPRYTDSVVIDVEVVRYLKTIADLAPLHMPAALNGIAQTRKLLPRVPMVACFDTAFHSTIPPAAATYAVPAEWREKHGIRRYGFHGFSHAYASRRAGEIVGGNKSELRVVTCHLGAGASLAAVRGGRSVDTTMGFTPLEGLVMATRSGSVDPGMLLWLQRHSGATEAELTDALDQRSGLLALSGTGDMRKVLQRMESGDERARLAFDVYVHRLRACVAAMAAAMGGLDVLVFTGGVGENAAAVRAEAVAGLGFLGVAIDPALNIAPAADADISAAGSTVHTLVIRAREDVEVARAVRGLVA